MIRLGVSVCPRVLLLVVACAAPAVGCAKPAQTPAVSPVDLSDRPATPISDAEFAQTVHTLLLSEDRQEDSKLRLAGVVQYQLARAQTLFQAGFHNEADDMVTGALLLLRHDDELLSATRGQAAPLIQAGHAAAKLGDAGRAHALYTLALAVADDSGTKQELETHLQAIDSWMAEITGSSALQQLGEKARAALSASVIDPRAENYLQARDSIINWMQAALSSSAGESQPQNADEREMAMEAYRAVRTGGPGMVALNMRQSTPAAAVDALRSQGLDRALPPGLIAQLEATSEKNSTEAWLSLFRQFETLRSEEASELSLPRYVNDAATFWAAIGLYRSAPGLLENAMPLAMVLVEFGMPEVASTLLSQNSDQNTRPDALAWSLTLVLRGLLELSRTDQLEAARRSYHEAARLLELSTQLSSAGPNPARAAAMMAALETRHAHVDEAVTLLEKSIALEPSAHGYLRLSRLERQQGRLEQSGEHAMKAVELAAAEGDLLLEAEAEQSLFYLARQKGDWEKAQAALQRALERIVVLQKMELPIVSTPTVERTLAQLLQYYDAEHEMRAAYQRALEASRSNPAELEATLTDMARSGLTWQDTRLSEQAVTAAIHNGLPAENSLYIALWHQLNRKRAGLKSDGIAAELFEQANRTQGWLSSLRSFGMGQLPGSELTQRAQNDVERTEAAFYSLVTTADAQAQLKSVAQSAAVDLIEVNIADDLTHPLPGGKKFALPPTLKLP